MKYHVFLFHHTKSRLKVSFFTSAPESCDVFGSRDGDLFAICDESEMR